MTRHFDGSMQWWLVTSLVAAGFFVAGCPPEKPSDRKATELEVEAGQGDELADGEAVVARIDGEEITREEFNRRIDGLVDFARARLQSSQRRRDFLASVVQFEILADEAERQGLGNHPLVLHAFEEAIVELMLEEMVSERVSMADVDEEARRAYFDEHIDEFHRPERRQIARLVVDDKDRAAELQSEIDAEETESVEEAAEEFHRRAYYYSTERETGEDGGIVGWYEPDDTVVFGEEIFEWEPGEVYGPFERDGDVVLKMVVDIEEAVAPTVDELERELTTAVYEKRRRRVRDEIVEETTRGADIEIFDERLDGIEPPRREAPPTIDDLPRQPVPETDSNNE